MAPPKRRSSVSFLNMRLLSISPLSNARSTSPFLFPFQSSLLDPHPKANPGQQIERFRSEAGLSLFWSICARF
jgi:hypothetical protein